MEIRCRFSGDAAVVHLTGRLVVSAGETEILPLRATIRELIARGTTCVVFNLAGLQSIDARGLGELVLTLTTLRSHGRELKLTVPNPIVRKLLSVTRLDTVLPFYASARDAIRSMAESHREGTCDGTLLTGRQIGGGFRP